MDFKKEKNLLTFIQKPESHEKFTGLTAFYIFLSCPGDGSQGLCMLGKHSIDKLCSQILDYIQTYLKE
jgi:hypothetical protein